MRSIPIQFKCLNDKWHTLKQLTLTWRFKLLKSYNQWRIYGEHLLPQPHDAFH